ncbi:MAG TPA: ABC transporter ATP-binding protein [Blastocatellia bacterium]|nr:ABC transporter ATP-binding protein [Blastocatellia bacterium]
MSEAVIKVEYVTKRYGEILAVDNLSLAVRRGEIYSLIGANGAGKSTLIRMIIGIAEPDGGKIFICGDDIATRAPEVKKHIGYLPEELILYNRLTGREYLNLVAGLKEADRSRISEEIKFFELERAQYKLAGGYSLGMRKKLGLAAAMIGSADVLVLDEPLNGLDVEMMRKLRLRIKKDRERGRSFLISSHVMSFVERISDRVGVMRAGKLVAEGSPAELREMTALTDAPFEDVFFQLAE